MSLQDVDDVLKFIEGSVSAAKESSEKRRAKKERQRAQRAEEARKREEQEELRKREQMTSRENENQTKKTQATANSARQNLTSRGMDKSMETITNKINSTEINKDSKSKSSNNTKSLEALKLKQMQELQQLQLMHLRQIHEQQLKIAMAEGGVRMTEAAAKEEVCSQLECTHEETLEEICEYTSTYFCTCTLRNCLKPLICSKPGQLFYKLRSTEFPVLPNEKTIQTLDYNFVFK